MLCFPLSQPVHPILLACQAVGTPAPLWCFKVSVHSTKELQSVQVSGQHLVISVAVDALCKMPAQHR